MENNKIKEKIEKLLNLSMSDNEHEANLARQRALKLMNEHNITKDEVYKQNMIIETVEVNFYRVPDWIVSLYNYMAQVSGCKMYWQNSWKGAGLATISIAGRERDVQNAIYLATFLYREVEKATKQFKKDNKNCYIGKELSLKVKSFKKGFISRVYWKMYNQKKEFFTQESEKGLVPVDTETREKEAHDYIHEVNDTIKTHKSQTRYDSGALREGADKGDELEINQAIHQQESIKKIGA
jgi:hypothetical protein